MSTIKVNSIKNTSTDDGGIAIDNSGHVQVDGVQLPTAGALSNRNLVINGAMQVSQRATSVTGVANNSDEGYQTLDRFGMYFGNSAGGVCTVSQATDVPSNQGFSNSIKIDVTTADTSVASNHEIYAAHKIESQTVRNSGWNYTSASSYVTLSFWAKSSKAGTYCVSARADDVGAKYYPFEYTLAADTWTKVTHSIPGDSALVFNNDSGSGLDVRWVLVAGSSRQGGTDGAWGATSTSNMATSNQVNFFDSTSNDFYLTGVQLEVGEKATPFEHRSFGDELQRCERYLQQWKGDGTPSTQNVICGASGINSTNSACFLVPSPKMRGPFSVSFDDIIISDSATYDADVSSMSLTNASADGAYVTASHASGGALNDAQSLRVKGGTNGYLRLEAEL